MQDDDPRADRAGGLPQLGPSGALHDVEGGSVLPALAEVHRRAGRPDEAEQVARRGLEFDPECGEARAVLALALLDMGRPDEARAALAPVAEALLSRHGLGDAETQLETAASVAASGASGLSEDELERAFEDAVPERDEMLDADRVAREAIEQADRELVAEITGPGPAPFATRTIADLLESQGDAQGAEEVRAVIEASREVVDGKRQRALGELERWLQNLQERRP